MNAGIANVSVVPVLARASLAAEQVTQLILGEAVQVISSDGNLLRVRTLLDDCEGWIHRGYLHQTTIGEAEAWLVGAGWSEGAELAVAGTRLMAPHRARLPLDGRARVRLPDGRPADIRAGLVRQLGEMIRDAQQVSPAEWAWREFAGTPYLWGGVSSAGIDCSGLVQTTFLARGIPLPRQASEQARIGAAISLAEVADGDLLFFRGSDTDAVDHVAIAAQADSIVHSTASTGQVTHESRSADSRAAPLLERLVAVRRLT